MVETLVKFQVLVNGLYGWGKGWLNPEYPARWNKLVRSLPEVDGAVDFRQSGFIDASYSRSEGYVGEEFTAYMHPMEIVGKSICHHCRVSDNEGETAGNYILAEMKSVVEAIRGAFPEVDIKATIRVKAYCIELDSPSYTLDA